MKKLLKELSDWIGILLALSLVLSFINFFTTETNTGTCKTNGYYLPATFVICKLKEVRE